MDCLIIVGAGGFGREVLAWARGHPDYGKRWTIGGFLDDNPAALRDHDVGVSVIASLLTYEPQRGDAFLCAIGTPGARFEAHEIIRKRGGRFITLVHPTALVGERVSLGQGAIVGPFALVSVDVRIEDGCAIGYRSSVGHDAVLGRFCQISSHCGIADGAILGAEVLMADHATVLTGIKVGDRAFVSAGAVVGEDMISGEKALGISEGRSLQRGQQSAREKNRLIIAGAGGAGLEAFFVARRERKWEVIGFADDDGSLNGLMVNGMPVLGTIDSVISSYRNCGVWFHSAIGNNGARKRSASAFEEAGFAPATLVDPSAVIAESAVIDPGAYIAPFAFVGPLAHVGRHVLINVGASLGHQAEAGDHSQLCPGARVSGSVRLGAGVLVGSNAVLTPGISVGEWATVAASSLATSNVPSRSTAIGVPAKILAALPKAV